MGIKRNREREYDRLNNERRFRVRPRCLPTDHERRSRFWHRRRSNEAVRPKRRSPFEAGVRTRAGAWLKTAFLIPLFAWDRVAAGSGRASRRATAESANGGRENG